MATLRELIIKISANSQSFQTEISRASRMGADYYKTMQNGGRQAAAASRETQKSIAELSEQLSTAKSTALSAAGAIAGAFATGNLIQIADEWVSVNARLKQASNSTDDFTASQRALMDISQRTGTAFSDNANLFSRSAASMREYGYSSDEVLKITEAISTGLKLSGASASESSSVITQFSQALAQGVLRGEEFNAVNESGDRVIRALAAGMGVARKDLKAMADDGQLTADKVVPALISQLGILQTEYVSLPQTVSSATTKVENSFMAWVGGANEASGATRTLTSSLNTVAENIDEVATAAGVMVTVGAARFFGNLVSGATSATVGLVNAARSEVALAEAQLRGTQISTARARAAVYRARQAIVAAKSADEQAAAEKRLGWAQNSLSRNIAARNAAQVSLNNVTAAGSRLMSGALGLVGGIPGLVLMGAGAWYTLYQNQEQARRSAQEYANTIDDIRSKTNDMSLSDTSDNEGKTRQAFDEQNRLVTEQEKKIRSIKSEIAGFRQMLANPGLTIGDYMVNHLMSVSDATDGLSTATESLAVEQERLSQMQAKSESIQSVLEALENRRIALIRQQAAEQNTAYQSLLMMNGEHTEFNRLLGLGNTLLMARQGLVNAPMRLPQADTTQKQADALQQSRQELELSRLKGAERERKRLGYAADALGLTADPQFQTNRQAYINQGMERWQNDEANKPKPKERKGQKTDEEKAEDAYVRLNKQQRESIALSGQNTELAKTKYQITHGELSVISDAHKQDLLRNAAALDNLNAVEKLKSLNEQLLTPEEALLNTTRERIKLLKEAAPATEEYRKTMEEISKASIQDAPVFDGIDASVGGASGELIKVADAQAELDKWHKKQLEMQKELLDEKEINEQTYADRVADINKTNAERLKDIQAGYTSASLSMFSDLAGQSAQLLQSIGQEGSLAYKTLFFASKAAAIAQAVINTELAATKAMAEGGMIMGIPAATAIRAVGYASVGLIAGQTLAGMAHDGIDRVPETGTWLLQKGERVVTASTSAKLDATLEKVQSARQGFAGGQIHIQNSYSGKPDDATLAAIDTRNRQLVVSIRKEMAAQVTRPTNEFGRALNGYYNRNRRE
ncbi:TPA: tape measure protein [Escherichia coli]|uniref:phage tail tape measure protein n=1 Tax=Escherichia coli TaxID=562 RepID=UPI000EAA5E3E|nr:phage tail tape measure protein [Escherichia coli]AYE16590.1 phage tail tape measure protein [Escherichia coli]ELK6715940.1 tape measure protein [Escherichia coli]MCO0526104.1 tape measure protein [Escherichia coli]MDU9464261.1 tape measure protein [Escherichia coli]MEC4631364.1 phage tail tape measure protein [Escherichia coli]